MYILYLDDSGSVANVQEEYFVLGGVAVPDRSVIWLSQQVKKLAAEVEPENPQAVEFHAAEIFSARRGVWKNYPSKPDRVNMIKRVLNVLCMADSDVVTFACAVRKRSFPNQDPVLKAFEEVSNRFNLFLRQKYRANHPDSRGLIVIDKTSYETGLQELESAFREQGDRWGQSHGHICEVPLFVDSRVSRITQLADHVAYAVFRMYNAADWTYFNCIQSRFYQSNGVIHSLKHLSSEYATCMCPACITRRLRPSVSGE